MRFKKTLLAWFILFGVLSIVNQSPSAVFVATIVSAGALGILLIASPTVLLYSTAAFLPAIAINRTLGGWRVAIILLVLAGVGLVPGKLSRTLAEALGQRLSAEDVVSKSSARPKSIELIGDDWSYLFSLGPGDRNVPCTDVCRKLLFNGEVEKVRMTRAPTRSIFHKGGPAASVTYHLEKRDSCPALFPEGSDIGKAVRDHIVAGNCLIAITGADQPLDATVSLLMLYHSHYYFPIPNELTPGAALIETVRRLSIEQQVPVGDPVHVLQQTETQARLLPMPFYFGYAFNTSLGGYSGASLRHQPYTMKTIDIVQALRDTFGFKIAPVEPPQPENGAEIAERVLALPAATASAFSAQQQDALNDVLVALRKQAELGDSDIDFISRVIRDERVNQSNVGLTLQELINKHRTRLVTVIPVLVQRLKFPVNQSIGHYQAGLGWTLMGFPAGALQPYRDAIIEIVEAQPDWYTGSLLSRITDLEGDPTDLITRRLEAKSDSTRQAAAVAICRSTRAIWEQLRPVAIAHLEADVKMGRGFRDESRKLLVALARFGENETAAKIIDASGAYDKVRYGQQIAALGQDFPVKTCLISN